ncbi:unnamed protein product [Ectocarpus fasciculatus]
MKKIALGGILAASVPSTVDALENGLARTPQMGWNSWNHFACDISEDLIKETADALVDSGLSKLGYEYLNLDDCWQAAARDGDGNVVPDPERFPSGLRALGDYIHSKGLKFGIYSSAGFKTCQALPASLGLEDLDAAKYAEWGVDYLKYDDCFMDHGAPQQRYPAMARALERAGRDVLYSLCEWGRENPAAWAGDVANSWRVSLDIRDDWRSIVSRANIDAPLWRYAGPGGWNDPDMLEIGNGGCSFEEYKSHFSLWAMLKAPLIIGNDIRDLTADDEALQILSNEELIAINQDPLGRQARRTWMNRDAPPGLKEEVWTGPLSDGSIAVMIFNKGPIEKLFEVTWDTIGLSGKGVYMVRDLWKHQNHPLPASESVHVAVASHGVVVLKLTPVIE